MADLRQASRSSRSWRPERPFRLHRFGIAFSAAGGFGYDTGIGTIPRPDDESARFLEGGYEYRRYFAARLASARCTRESACAAAANGGRSSGAWAATS